MKVIMDLCVVPIGGNTSLSGYVATCQKIIQDAGLKYELHANGTNIEGDYDLVFQTVKRCHERLHEMGAPRIHTIIKMGTRTDRNQSMGDKIDSVTRKLSNTD